MSLDFETRDLFPKAPSPEAFIGAASPLWGFFAGAALSGMTFWWMTRLMKPANLEALFARAGTLPEQAAAAAEAVVEPAVEAAAPIAAALVEPELPEIPVGGEAAPISPALEALTAANEVVAQAPEPPAPAPEPDAMAAPAVEPEMAAPVEPRSVKPKAKVTPPAEPPLTA